MNMISILALITIATSVTLQGCTKSKKDLQQAMNGNGKKPMATDTRGVESKDADTSNPKSSEPASAESSEPAPSTGDNEKVITDQIASDSELQKLIEARAASVAESLHSFVDPIAREALKESGMTDEEIECFPVKSAVQEKAIELKWDLMKKNWTQLLDNKKTVGQIQLGRIGTLPEKSSSQQMVISQACGKRGVAVPRVGVTMVLQQVSAFYPAYNEGSQISDLIVQYRTVGATSDIQVVKVTQGGDGDAASEQVISIATKIGKELVNDEEIVSISVRPPQSVKSEESLSLEDMRTFTDEKATAIGLKLAEIVRTTVREKKGNMVELAENCFSPVVGDTNDASIEIKDVSVESTLWSELLNQIGHQGELEMSQVADNESLFGQTVHIMATCSDKQSEVTATVQVNFLQKFGLFHENTEEGSEKVVSALYQSGSVSTDVEVVLVTTKSSDGSEKSETALQLPAETLNDQSLLSFKINQ